MSIRAKRALPTHPNTNDKKVRIVFALHPHSYFLTNLIGVSTKSIVLRSRYADAGRI